ncbi:MAG: amidohydrolase family protein [Firmicutes bacterium]|nr:amidohydrolase family protein [Bacillota bacterium]
MRLLFRHLDALVVEAGRPPLRDAWLAEDGQGRVAAAGTGTPPPGLDGGRDGRGLLAVPGLVNAHHHLYQTAARGRATGQGLFAWLTALYPRWGRLRPATIHAAAVVALAELVRSGATATVDHHYLYPPGAGAAAVAEALFGAADQVGIRLMLARGAITCGRSGGCLPPDELVEPPDAVWTDIRDLAARYHQRGAAAQTRVAVAPVSIMSTDAAVMRDAAELARVLNLPLHTHAGETRDEERYARQRYGAHPFDLLEEWGWLRPGTWLAHGVWIPVRFRPRLARAGVGVAHCPSSNLRLGSGVAPVRAYLQAGIPVGLGVDGSASNDGGHLWREARLALLLSGVRGRPPLAPAEALALATRGSARCLGWEGLGRLEPGDAADVAVYRLDDLEHAGMAAGDPLAAWALGWPTRAWTVLVGGRAVVEEGRLVTVEVEAAAAELRRRMQAEEAGG